MAKSKIEWTTETWNVITGCSKVSAGCKNCYAIRMSWRNQHNENTKEKYAGVVEKTKGGGLNFTGKVNFDEATLLKPLQTKKPTTYFVNSMSDLFQKGVPFEWIDKIMAVIALTPQHTYQVLTKRDERMNEYFKQRIEDDLFTKRIGFSPILNQKFIPKALVEMASISEETYKLLKKTKPKGYEVILSVSRSGYSNDISVFIESDFKQKSIFPLPNLWLGVSVENQETLSRIDNLRKTPAAVRFLSCEPLLQDLGTIDLKGIHWVICGGESGHGARPMHPDWVRSIQQQCQSAGVPFFFKQMSSKDNKDYKNFEAFPKDLQVREMPKI
jgi:protein gp37